MRDCRRLYPHALYMGVGGTTMFLPGVHRAPKFWQDLGLSGSIVCFYSRAASRDSSAYCAIYVGIIPVALIFHCNERVCIHILCNLFTRLILYLPFPQN